MKKIMLIVMLFFLSLSTYGIVEVWEISDGDELHSLRVSAGTYHSDTDIVYYKESCNIKIDKDEKNGGWGYRVHVYLNGSKILDKKGYYENGNYELGPYTGSSYTLTVKVDKYIDRFFFWEKDEYYSDWKTKTITMKADNSAPSISLVNKETIGTWYPQNTKEWSNDSVSITAIADDNGGSGFKLNMFYYKIGSNDFWGEEYIMWIGFLPFPQREIKPGVIKGNSVTLNPIDHEGITTVYFVAKDNVYNESSPIPFTVKIDKSGPAIVNPINFIVSLDSGNNSSDEFVLNSTKASWNAVTYDYPEGGCGVAGYELSIKSKLEPNYPLSGDRYIKLAGINTVFADIDLLPLLNSNILERGQSYDIGIRAYDNLGNVNQWITKSIEIPPAPLSFDGEIHWGSVETEQMDRPQYIYNFTLNKGRNYFYNALASDRYLTNGLILQILSSGELIEEVTFPVETIISSTGAILSPWTEINGNLSFNGILEGKKHAHKNYDFKIYTIHKNGPVEFGEEQAAIPVKNSPANFEIELKTAAGEVLGTVFKKYGNVKEVHSLLINTDELYYQMYSLNFDGNRRSDGKDLEGDDVEIGELYRNNSLITDLSYDVVTNSGIFPIPEEWNDSFEASYFFSVGEYSDSSSGPNWRNSEVDTPDYQRQTTIANNEQIVIHIDKLKPQITGFEIRKGTTLLSPNVIPTNQLDVKLNFRAEDAGSYPSGIREVKVWNKTDNVPADFYTVTEVLSPLSNLSEAEQSRVQSGVAGIRILFDKNNQPEDKANISFNIDWKLQDGFDGERSVSINATDYSGNLSDENSTTVVYDTVPPQAPDINTITRSHSTNTITVNWKAVSDASTYEVLCAQPVKLVGLEAEIDVTGITPNTALPVTIYAIDKAGNRSVTGTVFTPYTLASPGNLSSPVESYDSEARKYSLEWELTGGSAFKQFLEVTITDTSNNIIEDTLNIITEDGRQFFRLENIPPHSTVSYVLTAYSGFILPGVNEWEVLEEERVSGTGSSNSKYTIENSAPVFLTNIEFSPSGGYVLSNFNFEYPSATDKDGDSIVYTIYYAEVVDQAPLNFKEYTESVTLLPNVQYTWKLTADDGYGGITSSEEFLFTIDDTPPELVINNEPDQDVFTNQKDLNFTAIDNESGITKVIYWTSDERVKPEDNMEIPIDENAVQNSFSGNIPLHDGSYTVTLKAFNGAANTATILTKTLYVDTVAPDFADQQIMVEMDQGIVPGSSKDITAYLSPDRTVTVNMLLQNEFSGFRYIHYAVEKMDGSEIIIEGKEEISLIPDMEGFIGQISKNFKWDILGNDGNYYYLLLALEDHAGNISEFLKGAKPFFIDTTAPDITNLEIVSGLVRSGTAFYLPGINSNDYTLGNLDILFDPKDSNIESSIYVKKYYALTSISEDAGNLVDELSEWYLNWDTLKSNETLIPGRKYKITVRAENMLNLSTIVNSSEFTFDNTPPENLTITTIPASSAMVNQEIRINSIFSSENGKADPEVPINEYRLKIGKTDGSDDLTRLVEGNVNGELINRNGSFVFSIPDDINNEGNFLISDGNYQVTLSVENAAGLTSIFRSTFQIDNSPKEVIIINDSGPYESAHLSATWGHGYKYTDRVTSWEYRIINKDDMGNSEPVTAWINTTNTEAIVAIESLDGIINGDTYHYEVRAIFDDGSYTNSYMSNGMYVDYTEPKFALIDGYITPAVCTTENIRVSWKASDDETQILKADILVESYDESNSPVSSGWKEVILQNYNENSVTIDPYIFKDTIGFLSGKKIYVSLRLQNQSGLTASMKSGAILIDNTPPSIPLVLMPGNFIHTSQYPAASWLWSRDSKGNIIPLDDPESGIKNLQWTLANSLIDFDPQNAIWYESMERVSVDIEDFIEDNPDFIFNRKHGENWFFIIKATNNADLCSIGYSRSLTYDDTAPLIKDVILLNGNNLDTAQSVTYIKDTSNLILYINAIEDVSNFNGFNATYGSWNINGNYHNDPFLTEPDPDIEYNTPAIDEEGNEVPYLLKIESPEPEIENGEIVFFEAGVTNSTGLYTKWYSKGVMLDTGKPSVSFVNGYLSNGKLYFDWEAKASFAPIIGYSYQLIEAGSNPGDNWSELITSSAISIDCFDDLGNQLIEEGKWQLIVQAHSAAGAVSDIDTLEAKSPVIVLDHSPAVIENYEYTEFASNSISFSCNAVENLSDITDYQFALGSLQDKFAFTGGEWLSVSTNATTFSHTIEFNDIMSRFNTEITDMADVYLRVRVRNSAGHWSLETAGVPVIVDKTTALITDIQTGNYTIFEHEIQEVTIGFKDYESGVSAYRVAIVKNNTITQLDNITPVTISPSESNWIDTITVYSTETPLEDGAVYYIALQVRNSAEKTMSGVTAVGEWSNISFSNPIIIDLTDPVLNFVKDGVQNPDEMIVNNRNGSFDVAYEVSEDVSSIFSLLDPDGQEVVEPSINLVKGSYIYEFTGIAYGTYTLTADLTDLSGRTGSCSQQIRVNVPPEPGFSYNQFIANPARVFKFSTSEIPENAEANIHNQYSIFDFDGDEIAGYEWDFDYDGINFTVDSTLMEPEYSYSLLSTDRREYTVALRIIDSGGKVSEIVSTSILVENTTSGMLYEGEIWSGIHTVIDDIIVPEALTLSLERGTEVLFDGNPVTGYDHEIRIYGKIDIPDGANFHMTAGVQEFWSGIIIEGKGNLREVAIKDAQWGLSLFDEAVITLENSVFEDNLNGIQVYNNSPVIQNCMFRNNRYYGIKEDAGGSPSVLECTFNNNGIDYYDQQLAVINIEELNSITGNSGNIKE